MTKMLKRLAPLVLVLAIVLTMSQSVSAATDVSTAGEAARYETTLTDGAVVSITNNYMSSDLIAITTADGLPAIANTVYWVYMPGPTDRSAQLGSITIRKGATSGRLSISNVKLGDFHSGYVNVVNGVNLDACDYGPAGKTVIADLASNVTLRNSATGTETLIIDKSVVTKGMTAYAVVGGKIYKATAKADGVDLMVALAANMEVDTPVWYTVAAAGRQDVGYKELILGDVLVTDEPDGDDIKLFFQGDANSSSSMMIFGLKPGDIVRCYGEDGKLKKSGTVASTGTVATLTGLKLYADETLDVTVTEKGKLESAATQVSVPSLKVPAALKSSGVIIKNTIADGTIITVKNITLGDKITIYDVHGGLLGSLISDDPADPEATKGDVVFTAPDFAVSTPIYISVESTTATTNGESAYLKLTVPTPK